MPILHEEPFHGNPAIITEQPYQQLRKKSGFRSKVHRQKFYPCEIAGVGTKQYHITKCDAI